MKEKNTSQPINQDEIQSYLKDLRKIKVMTPEREKELAKLISSGNLTDTQRKKINKELVEGNLRFVITVAKQYQNQGLDFPDLIAEGNMGLIKAIHNFDWSKNLRFISYAVWWVRQCILQSLNENARTIRLPVNVVQDLHRAKKEIENSGNQLPEKFTSLPSMVNLNDEINEDGDTLIDVIVNENVTMPDEVFNTKDKLKQKLMEVLNVLDERERVIIEDYFGLAGTPRTLEDIGEDFDLTKERVRQIKEKALRKLRNESSELFDYI
jgi:RNA polymerase primary sigma factor